MSSVDNLFQKPVSISNPKRKLEDPTTAFSRPSSNKKAKFTNGTSPYSGVPTGLGSSAPRPAFVEDEISNDQTNTHDVADDDDIEAGPAPPPEDEDEIEEDDEGRFFGSGVTNQEKEIIDYIDRNEDGEEVEEKYDSAWLVRTLKSLDKAIRKNTELRSKYPNDPMKFVSSEADLDAEIKGLSLLSENGALYGEFVKLGGTDSLTQLLTHENTDIAISVIQAIEDLTDEDVSATAPQWRLLADGLMKQDLAALLASNLTRLAEEASESDRDGVYHVLGVFENLLSQPTNVDRIGSDKDLVQWLQQRVKRSDPDARGQVGQNRQYAAEILAILLQGSKTNRRHFADMNGAEDLLVLLHHYRSRDPEKDSDEEEFVENLFDCLTCLVEESEGAEKFLAAEGVQLCLLMLRDGSMSRSRAIKVLDHAMSGDKARLVCEQLVEAAGLKTLFGMLMKSKKKGTRDEIEHIIGILSSLLRYTAANSEARIRTLAKFVEKNYEKVARLVELRKEYSMRLDKITAEIASERQKASEDELEELEDEWLSRRLDAGLFALQTLDVILSWLVAEDAGARRKIIELLQNEGGLKTLNKSLDGQLQAMDATNARSKEAKDVLEALLRCLQ